MKVLEMSPVSLLGLVLRSNALFSGLSGLIFIVVADYLATLVGIGREGFISIGINLLIFGLLLWGLSNPAVLGRTWALVVAGFVIILDILWVLISTIVALMPSITTNTGALMIWVIAGFVGTFAFLQSFALVREIRSRWKSRLASSFPPVAMFVLLILPMIAGCSLADIRTASLKEKDPDASMRERGRQILRKMADAHGVSVWRSYSTQEVILEDAWQAESWWPIPEQRIALRSIKGTFTARVTFLNGPKEGEQIGIQSWRAYHRGRDGHLAFDPPNEEPTSQNFYIPSLQYFNELPFRILNAEYVAYAGQRAYRGNTYYLVLATWGSFEPNTVHDQYLLWIDSETYLLSMCQYTLRDAAPAFTGTIHFEEYREVQGVQFPFKHTVVLPAPQHTLYPLDKYFFHQSRVESVKFDGFDKEQLIVDASLIPGDVKE